MSRQTIILCDVCGKQVAENAKCAVKVGVYPRDEKMDPMVKDSCSQGCTINWLSSILAESLRDVRYINVTPLIPKLEG